MRPIPPLALAALALATAACAGPATPPSEPIAPTYEAIATRVLSNCTTRSCHGAEGGRGGLVLTPDRAYEALVGVPASNDTARARGKLRVRPGDPDASYLLQKLVGPAADEGQRMPLVGEPLSSEAIAALRGWIAAGAPRGIPASPAP